MITITAISGWQPILWLQDGSQYCYYRITSNIVISGWQPILILHDNSQWDPFRMITITAISGWQPILSILEWRVIINVLIRWQPTYSYGSNLYIYCSQDFVMLININLWNRLVIHQFKKRKENIEFRTDFAINDNWWTLESNIYQTFKILQT